MASRTSYQETHGLILLGLAHVCLYTIARIVNLTLLYLTAESIALYVATHPSDPDVSQHIPADLVSRMLWCSVIIPIATAAVACACSVAALFLKQSAARLVDASRDSPAAADMRNVARASVAQFALFGVAIVADAVFLFSGFSIWIAFLVDFSYSATFYAFLYLLNHFYSRNALLGEEYHRQVVGYSPVSVELPLISDHSDETELPSDS